MHARKQSLFRQLQATLNREDLTNCLYLTGNPRADHLLDMMLDPAYANLSFGQLCSRAGLSFADVTHLYCRRQLQIGMITMAQYLPEIMEAVALAALHRLEMCERCEGTGKFRDNVCRRCRGTGEIVVEGDIDAMRLVFKMNGLIH